MAQSSTQKKGSQTRVPPSRSSNPLLQIVHVLASLKLTVVLLSFGIFAVLTATFQLAWADMWAVKRMHFPNPLEFQSFADLANFFVYIPFQTYFIPAWFPESQGLKGGFYMPAGVVIIVAMMINLTSAHMVRFRLQAKGMEMLVGLMATIAGAVMVYAIVILGQNREGVQDTQFISNDSLWYIILGGVAFLSLTCAIPAFTLDRSRRIESAFAMLGSISLAGVFIFMLSAGKTFIIDDSGMRIVWLMMQGAAAGLVLLTGCLLLFKRKGGIVLIHSGLMLLMVGEMFTTYTAVESQMGLYEGQTKDYSEDIRHVELAVVDTTAETHRDEVLIPDWMLGNERPSDLIEHEELPFDLQVDRYYVNSVLELNKTMPSGTDRPRPSDFLHVERLQQSSGATMTEIDRPSIKLTLLEKNTNQNETPREIASLIASQSPLPAQLQQVLRTDALVEQVDYKGRTYQVYLRFRRIYKPYELKLVDTNRELYVGTNKPKSFSSEFQLTDHRFNTKTDHHISMNNPLRYGNETFYQQNYDDVGGREYSGIQIVYNHGWMIPYVCCMIVGIGLLAHFLLALFNFLVKSLERMLPVSATVVADRAGDQTSDMRMANNQTSHTAAPVISPVDSHGNLQQGGLFDAGDRYELRSRFLRILIPISVTVFVLAVSAITMIPFSKTTDDGIDLNQLGHIPVTSQGRTLPLDSYARNLARKFSKYESLVDGNGDKQPAIKWLADVMFEAPGHNDYQLFRVDEPSLRYALFPPPLDDEEEKLAARKGFRYSVNEIETNLDVLNELAEAASQKDSSKQTNEEKKAIELSIKWREYQMVVNSIKTPSAIVTAEDGYDRIGDTIMDYSTLQISSEIGWPLLLQTDQLPEETWVARSRWANLKWFKQICDKYAINGPDNIANAEAVANILATEYFGKHLLETAIDHKLGPLLDQMVVEEMMRDEQLRNKFKDMTDEQFRSYMSTAIENSPPNIADAVKKIKADNEPFARRFLENQLGVRVDKQVEQFRRRIIKTVLDTIGKHYDINSELRPNETEKRLVELQTAYLENDVETFNDQVKTYLAETKNQPTFSSFRVNVEWYYNTVYPWFTAIGLYMIAFLVSASSWIVAPRTLGRTSLGILSTAMLLHLSSIVFRIIVSGRAPVTNIYSSVLFVGLVVVVVFLLLELFIRMGICRSLASLAGFGSLMLANGFSYQGDTIAVMQAVLDTNFWLSSHVVCISIGYSATLIAGFLGCTYIVTAVSTPVFAASKMRQSMLKAIYGTTCFAMIFSFVGTVLGGLWADDSWGRFWGWDPKENGALLIVLANALLLHARWCGLARDRGIAILAVLGNIVTAWSWFAVNEMGIGLHSYGFTEGTMRNLSIFWVTQLVVIGLACLPYKFWVSRNHQQSAR
jgi:ABC-type transport system involved in cytochrome c biogenesis permease subunit